MKGKCLILDNNKRGNKPIALKPNLGLMYPNKVLWKLECVTMLITLAVVTSSHSINFKLTIMIVSLEISKCISSLTCIISNLNRFVNL